MNKFFYNIASGNAEIVFFRQDDSSISLPLKLRWNTNQCVVDSKLSHWLPYKLGRNEEDKTRTRKKGTNRSHDLKKKAQKPCKVLQRFFAKLNESMKLLRSERTRIIFWRSLPVIGSKVWYKIDVCWKKIVVFIVQSGLKLYDFNMVAAGLS